jgi:hypothetical protein
MAVVRRTGSEPVIRALLCLALLVGGSLLVLRGVRSMGERGRVADVAIRFLEAVRDGDALAAHALLADPQRSRHARRVATTALQPTPDAAIDLHTIRLDGDTATVEARIERQGYVVRPRLTLKRRANGEWRITGVGHLEVDPRWVDRFAETLPEQDRPLADVLRSDDRAGRKHETRSTKSETNPKHE